MCSFSRVEVTAEVTESITRRWGKGVDWEVKGDFKHDSRNLEGKAEGVRAF